MKQPAAARRLPRIARQHCDTGAIRALECRRTSEFRGSGCQETHRLMAIAMMLAWALACEMWYRWPRCVPDAVVGTFLQHYGMVCVRAGALPIPDQPPRMPVVTHGLSELGFLAPTVIFHAAAQAWNHQNRSSRCRIGSRVGVHPTILALIKGFAQLLDTLIMWATYLRVGQNFSGWWRYAITHVTVGPHRRPSPIDL